MGDARAPTPAEHWARARPWPHLALAMALGVVMGHVWPWVDAWIALGAALVGIAMVMALRRRLAGARTWGLLAVVALSAAWLGLRVHHVHPHDIVHHVGDTAQLAHVTGTIVSEAHLTSPRRGAFGDFAYQSPGTLFVLAVDRVRRHGVMTPARGRLLVRIDAADLRPRPGQRVAATGWLVAIDGPVNPGEIDYRALLAEQGVRGRLTLPTRGNLDLLASPSPLTSPVAALRALRHTLAESMRASLHLGLAPVSADDHAAAERLALLEALLLGRWGRELEDTYDAFQRVGLAHLLSISGAHLGILMGLTWLVVRLVVRQPARAALVLLAVLAFYLMAVPLRVPIVRAAIMAACFCVGYACGRGTTGLGMLAMSMVIVLLWRPTELFSSGFQLSFGVVAGLLLFVQPVSQWLWPAPMIRPIAPTLGEQAARWAVDYLAVSIVAFAIALPLVAYHYGLISPLAIVLSVLALPVVTGLLGLGYLKMLMGLLLPSGSVVLSGPVAWISDTMLNLVDHASRWPGSAVTLPRPVTLAWVVAVIMLVVALLSGRFAHRRWAMGAAALLLVGWTLVMQRPTLVPAALGGPAGDPRDVALRLNMFAVGDGSCYLVRFGDHALMFDCGSQAYLDVGERSIVPALQHLGVHRIDTLVLSHADIDHYAGSLDVADRIDVGRVLVPPQLLDEANVHPDRAAAFLVDQLIARGLPPQPVARGWRETFGDVELHVLWPLPEYAPRRANDSSLVLSIRAGSRRVLLVGDIQDDAIGHLLTLEPDLRADVLELPHHGSMTERSGDLLAAVQPAIALQSCSRTRLRRDPWPPLLARHDITRLTTADLGMVELTLPHEGDPRWQAFRQKPPP